MIRLPPPAHRTRTPCPYTAPFRSRGFVLTPHSAATFSVLAPPAEGEHGKVLSLLADSAAWSSSALGLALGVSPRTVQRMLQTLAGAGKVESFGRGRARRWVVANMPGFPTVLLLPAPPMRG